VENYLLYSNMSLVLLDNRRLAELTLTSSDADIRVLTCSHFRKCLENSRPPSHIGNQLVILTYVIYNDKNSNYKVITTFYYILSLRKFFTSAR